ncbi:MAG: sulfur oxidation c-type cytochrome SoxA, partial [Pelagibacterales bacterium]|nr:sulfur oxidation c-type cytochrome SoxA [Pelagibacterales bacterium]
RWEGIASVHRRFQFCNNQARAQPLEIGHNDYNALQLYVAWRGNGLSIETPSVRR